MLFYLILQQTPRFVRLSGILLALIFGGIIAISRVEVNAHSLSESISGWVLGALVGLTFIWMLSKMLKVKLHPWLIMVSLLVLTVTPYIEPTPTQRWLTNAALNLSGHDRPYIRATGELAPLGWRPSNANEIEP